MSLSLRLLMLNALLCVLFYQIPTLHALPVAPISKDESTNLFTISVSVKTPPRPTELYLDLDFLFPWMVCDASSSSRSIPCNSTSCSNLRFKGLSCANSACKSFPENPVTGVSSSDKFLLDTLSLRTESSTGLHLPNFTFSCARSSLLKGLPKNVTGLATLGRSQLGLSAQIRSVIPPFLNAFALCLPASSKAPGVAIFASAGPFYSSPSSSSKTKIDLSESFVYTSLLSNPVAAGDTQINYTNNLYSQQYFIDLTDIRINGRLAPINESIFTISQDNGFGGTKISTATPYTLLESSIHRVFTKLFIKEASSSTFNLTAVTSPVKPFSVCYHARDLKMTRVGPLMPGIDFLSNSNVFWRILGGNSMVRVTDKRKGLDLWCLGFVDGGMNMKTPITIGGKQLEDTLLLIDVESEIFGITSSLLSRSLSCAHVHAHYFPHHKK